MTRDDAVRLAAKWREMGFGPLADRLLNAGGDAARDAVLKDAARFMTSLETQADVLLRSGPPEELTALLQAMGPVTALQWARDIAYGFGPLKGALMDYLEKHAKPCAPCSTCLKQAVHLCDYSMEGKVLSCPAVEAWVKTVPMDAMVEAIRSDKAVGRGTCSTVDECMDKVDIIKYLAEDGITTPLAAVKWAREYEGLKMEQACNQRWGEDDDPQLQWSTDFEARCADNPVE